MIRSYGWIFVSLTVLLVTVLPFISINYFYTPWLSFYPERYYYTWPFLASVISIWINYYLACRTPPGSSQDYESTTRKARWCKDCKCFKAPRSHHCSICDRCVLKMDHHCPWLNTCVGFGNYAYFIRFLGSVFSAVTYGLFLVGLRIWDVLAYQNDSSLYYAGKPSGDWMRYTPPLSDLQILVMIIIVISFFLLLLSVGILFIWHLYYISQNITTIEDFENSAIERLQRSKIIPNEMKYPYDLGTYKNFQSVFGSRPYLWCFPFQMIGSGFQYETNSSDNWPPREYYLHKKYPHGKQSKETAKERSNNPIVRRGSEGFLVQQLSSEDREKMLNGTYEADIVNYISSTDYDSLDESTDSDNEFLALKKLK